MNGKTELTFKEGYIPDFATGKPVDIRKPEETVRLTLSQSRFTAKNMKKYYTKTTDMIPGRWTLKFLSKEVS